MPAAPRFLSVREGALGRRLSWLMALGFLALIAAIGFSAWQMQRNEAHTRWVIHTYEVENAILDLRRLVEEGETIRRGYLLAPGVPTFLPAYRAAAVALPSQLAALRALTRDNPRQQAALAQLDDRLSDLMARRRDTIALAQRGDADRAVAQFRREAETYRLREIRGTLRRMIAEERRLLAIRDNELQRSAVEFYVALALAGVLLLGVATIALLTVLVHARDLGRSRASLAALNDHLEDRVADRTADLVRANDEIQRFAYIVSHDLRSPLVNVMGFTAELDAAAAEVRALIDRAEAAAPEILTEDARIAAREDLPEAIGFIRTSTQKMDRLINAILQLSRQGRRVLSPEPVDLAAMVGTIRETLAHRLAEADAELVVEGSLPAIVTDRFSLDQILSNLIENAAKYLKPGVPGRIVVRGRREGSRALIEVADNGRGIEPRDHQRVFDLFRRSGQQDRPGEGIGLATVRALVFRLGGVIDLQSTLGEGATFRLSLPLSLETQETSE